MSRAPRGPRLVLPEDRAFAEWIATQRQAQGVGQQALAEKSAVVSKTAMWKIEHGERAVTIGEAMHLTFALGHTLRAIPGGDVCQGCFGAPPHGFICKRCGAGGEES